MKNHNKASDFAPALVRDAGGLDAYEKTFLYTLASHEKHVEFAHREVVRARTGLAHVKFGDVVRSLKAKGLIKVGRGRGGIARYTLDCAGLKRWTTKHNAKSIGDARRDRINVQRRSRERLITAINPSGRIGQAGVDGLINQALDEVHQGKENQQEENNQEFKNMKRSTTSQGGRVSAKRQRVARPIRRADPRT